MGRFSSIERAAKKIMRERSRTTRALSRIKDEYEPVRRFSQNYHVRLNPDLDETIWGKGVDLRAHQFGVEMQKAKKTMLYLKKSMPKLYQGLKDYAESLGPQWNSINKWKGTSSKIAKTGEEAARRISIGLGNKTPAKISDTAKTIEMHAKRLAERNLMPAAAVGGASYISSKNSPNGYAYGGMVSKKRLFRGVRRKAK